MTPFDSLSHPCAMMFAVSSSSADPMNAFASLFEQASQHDVFTRQPYVEAGILRCYLVVHDSAVYGDDMTHSIAVLDEVRHTYGLQCGLLRLHQSPRSVPAGPESSAGISAEDATQIRAYVRELVSKSIVPYLERSSQQLNEQLVATRQGFTGRLWGASRKLFSGGKTAEAPMSEHTLCVAPLRCVLTLAIRHIARRH